MTDNIILVYVTCSSKEEAGQIVSNLLEGHLIACANIMPPHTAMYRWQGAVETATECAVIMKTRTSLFERVREAVCALHSYDCPCIISWPLAQGHMPYLDWIGTETAGA